jgi:hypothetical protein
MYVNVPWENTWRGIQNNLTSDSTTDSLSAAQGKALNDNKVSKSGDTMTGNLNVLKASDAYVRVRETGTGIEIYLDAAGALQGIFSNGYWNGSAFVSAAKWIVQRGTDGDTKFRGTADDSTKLNGVTHRGYLRSYINYNDISSIDTVGADNYLYAHSDTGNYTGGTKPPGSHNGFGVFNVHSHSGNYCQQLGFDCNNDALWFRTANEATTFNAWKKIISTANAQNNLTSSSETDYLSAKQGKTLYDGWTLKVINKTIRFTNGMVTVNFSSTVHLLAVNAVGTQYPLSFTRTANFTGYFIQMIGRTNTMDMNVDFYFMVNVRSDSGISVSAS